MDDEPQELLHHYLKTHVLRSKRTQLREHEERLALLLDILSRGMFIRGNPASGLSVQAVAQEIVQTAMGEVADLTHRWRVLLDEAT